MQISLTPIRPPHVRFQGAPQPPPGFQKLDDTLQKIHQKYSNGTAFPHRLPVTVHIPPAQKTPALVQQIKDISLNSLTHRDKAVTSTLFDHVNVPGALDSDKHVHAGLINVKQLEAIAQLPDVSHIQDSSFWAAWDIKSATP